MLASAPGLGRLAVPEGLKGATGLRNLFPPHATSQLADLIGRVGKCGPAGPRNLQPDVNPDEEN